MADIETLKTRLEQAETARHSLALGEGVASVDYGDRKVAYTPAQLTDLDRYINDLKAQIRRLETGRPVPRRSPVVFG